MSLHSYTVAQNTTENPRQTEYRLFAQVTRALMEWPQERCVIEAQWAGPSRQNQCPLI